LSTTQDELARKVETEKRQAEEKAVPMQVEKAAEVPAPAAVATGSKETEEEVKKWKSEAKRMRSRVEEKETESESWMITSSNCHSNPRADPTSSQSTRLRRISRLKSRSPKKPCLKQSDEPLPLL
jgi:hypothetical protein